MPRIIHLLPDFEASLDRMVASGRYGSDSDVIMYALAALEDQEAVREARERKLNALIQEGLDDAEAGRTVSAEEVFRDLDEVIARAEARQVAAE